MRILYIHQHFTTNAGASGTRSYDYARYLVARGHRVTVITGVYTLGPFAGRAGPLIEVRAIDGIRVVVIRVSYANQMSAAARVLSFLLFSALSVFTCLGQGRVDVVLATSTPLTVGLPALLMRWLRRAPYVFEVRDIWPECAVSTGVLTHPLLIRLAAFAERLFYRNAARVQTISPGMCELLARRGLPEAKLTMVPTGLDLGLYQSAAADGSLRAQLGWQDRLIAVYAGAHSDANGLEYILGAAEATRDDDRIGYLLIGEGRRKRALVAAAQKHGLTNVAFQPRMPKRRLVGTLVDADVGMLILRPLPEFVIAMPNKLFDYLGAGLAVAVNFQGDASTQLAAAGAGLATDSTNPGSLARALQNWADHPCQLRWAKRGARELAKQYDRRDWAGKVEDILAAVVAEHKR